MEEKKEEIFLQSPSPEPDRRESKLYYSIGEVAALLGENASLLRFWEKQFPGISPKRNIKGNRIYTNEQLKRIMSIHYLVKGKGYTLAGAKDALKQSPREIEKQAEIRQSLTQLREWLIQLRQTL
jgi:DNA-binding transcriptional MerR regulator